MSATDIVTAVLVLGGSTLALTAAMAHTTVMRVLARKSCVLPVS